MTRRRLYPLLLCAFLASSAIVTWMAFARSSERNSVVSWADALGSVETRVDSEANLSLAAARSQPLSEVAQDTQRASALAPVFTLPPESAAQLTEQIELNGLASQAGLSLTSAQLKAFAEVTSLHQAIREAYEEGIASLGRSPGGSPRLEIPLYAEAGDALRTAFYSALRDALGDSLVAQIVSKVGLQLETRFAGFGVSAQTVELASPLAPETEAQDLVLNHTVVYWNPLDAVDHLVTRCESDFPGVDVADGRGRFFLESLLKAKSLASQL